MKDREIINSVIRGSRKDQTRRIRPRVVGSDLDKVVDRAISEDDLLGARADVIAYSFLLRCGDELFNLQIDGRDSDGYHSHIVFEKKSSSGPASATVHLASRKNAPGGATISRPCLCSKGHPSSRCGVCALIAVAHSYLSRGAPNSTASSAASRPAVLPLSSGGGASTSVSTGAHGTRSAEGRPQTSSAREAYRRPHAPGVEVGRFPPQVSPSFGHQRQMLLAGSGGRSQQRLRVIRKAAGSSLSHPSQHRLRSSIVSRIARRTDLAPSPATNLPPSDPPPAS